MATVATDPRLLARDIGTQTSLSVGIATRNRPDSLMRCLASLALIDDIVSEIIIVDDASDIPICESLRRWPALLLSKVHVIEQPAGLGYIVGRNTIMKRAVNDYVLSMDDDAYLLDGEGIRRAFELIRGDPLIAAVACAQAERDGSPWPAAMQPSPVSYTCYVTAYIGFAHLVRRRLFIEVGGYQEAFHFYGEEKDFCIRALDAGYRVVYMPDVRVAHVIDPAGRSDVRYVRYLIRNDCLASLYNEPWPLPFVSLPLRVWRYLAMRRHGRVRDPGGLWWVVTEVVTRLPAALRTRKPVKWATVRRWRRLRRDWPAYRPERSA